jgi:Tol biopolymer transport system component
MIVFDSPHDQGIDVFTISAAGGSPRALTVGKAPCGAASYSRHRGWIYYHCIEAGVRQIWRKAAAGGTPERVGLGMAQLESPDGRYLYFARQTGMGASPLWRQPTDGGEAVQVLPDVDPFRYAVAPDGVYFGQGPDERGICSIWFLHAASGKISIVLSYSGRPSAGMSVSPDGAWLLYSYDEQRNTDLMIVEDFH